MAELSNTRPPAKKPLTISSRRGPSEGPGSHLERNRPKENNPTVTTTSGTAENSCGENGFLHPCPPPPSRLARRRPPPIYSSFKVIHAFPNGDLDVSQAQAADLPSLAATDLKPVVKSPLEKACAINREKLLGGTALPTPSHLNSLSSPSSPFVAAIVISPLDHLGVSQVDPATTVSEVRTCIVDQEKGLARDSPSPPPAPPYSPTPSFDVIRIFPDGDSEVLETTILSRSLDSSYAQIGPSPVFAGSRKNPPDPDLEKVVLVALAWTFALSCGFGFLLLLAEWTHNACTCSLMVVVFYNLGVHLVMKKCVKKRIPVSSARIPEDGGITRSKDLECAGFESHDDVHSGTVHINGRFEVSSIRSSQDIFPSELLMNGQVFSVSISIFLANYLANPNFVVYTS
jgi:hypothetical protein